MSMESLGLEIFVEIFEQSPDAILIADEEGQIRLVNRKLELMFGYHRTELLGKQIEVLTVEAIRDKHKIDRESYMRDPRPRSMGLGMVLKGRHRTGYEFDVEIELSPIATAHGIVVISRVRKKTP